MYSSASVERKQIYVLNERSYISFNMNADTKNLYYIGEKAGGTSKQIGYDRKNKCIEYNLMNVLTVYQLVEKRSERGG